MAIVDDGPGIPASVFGWSVSVRTNTKDRPVVRLERGELWVLTEGRKGTDPEILYQRALIAAIEKELELAAPQQKDLWRKRLARARMEEHLSMMTRIDPR